MTSSLTSHGSVNDITQHFPSIRFLCYHLIRKCPIWDVDGKFQGQTNVMGIWPFVSINVSFGEIVPLKIFPWIFPHPNFIKKMYYYIRCIKWCKCWTCTLCTLSTSAFQALLQFLHPQFHHQVLLNCFWWVYITYIWNSMCNTESEFRQTLEVIGTVTLVHAGLMGIAGTHYTDVILGAMASQITSFTIVYSTVYSGADERNIKAPRHWPLCGEFTGDRSTPRTNGQ